MNFWDGEGIIASMNKIDDVKEASFLGIENPKIDDFLWDSNIEVGELCFKRVGREENKDFLNICNMYKVDGVELRNELEINALYAIYEKGTFVGAITAEVHPTMDILKKQVSENKLAQSLYSRGKFLELSYAFLEEFRGRGLGSRAVKGFMDHAKNQPFSKHFFAVVKDDNVASIKILEKNGFVFDGTYVHDQTKEVTKIYSYQF